MTRQLTTHIDVDQVAAPGSRPAATPSRILALAAAAGCQFLAFAAVAQPITEPDKTPILDPASLGVGFVVGLIVGVVAVKATSRKK
jgi:hypothetical protein